MTTSSDGPDARSVWRVPRTEWAPAGLGLVAVLVMAAAPSTVLTYAGLDPSWTLSLNVARADSFEFGRDMVFTYGSWGYLDHPAPVGNWLFLAALTYSVVVVAALYLASYVALRRRWEASPVVAGSVAAAVTAILTSVSERSGLAVAACGLAGLIHALGRAEGARPRGVVTALPLVIAVAAGLLVHVKFSVGVTVAVVAFLTALGDLQIRRLVVDTLATGIAFLTSFLLFWLLAGQSLQWLPEWVRASIELVRGYSEAMAAERQDHLLGYLVGGALVVFVVVVWVRLVRRIGVRRALVPLLIAAALGGFAFKAAFTRHDDHELTFFVVSTAILLALAPLARHRVAAVVALAAAILMVVPGTSWFDAKQARDRWRVALQIASSDNSASAYHAESKAQGRATYGLPEEFVTAIADHPVWVDPWEAALAIDYDMAWHPAPVPQNYVAFTPYLDRLNARAAQRASDDQVVLRYPSESIDGRNPRWETPEYTLTLACQYTQELTNGLWSLMSHDEPRCGRRQEVGSAHVGAGEVVSVPKTGPDEMLVARFEPDQESLLRRLAHALVKDRTALFVTADDDSYRLPEALAGGPLLVAYPDRGDQGLFPAYAYDELAFTMPGTLSFDTIPLEPLDP